MIKTRRPDNRWISIFTGPIPTYTGVMPVEDQLEDSDWRKILDPTMPWNSYQLADIRLIQSKGLAGATPLDFEILRPRCISLSPWAPRQDGEPSSINDIRAGINRILMAHKLPYLLFHMYPIEVLSPIRMYRMSTAATTAA